MAQNETIEQILRATELQAKVGRRSQQMEIIHAHAKQRVKEASRTGKEPLSRLAYMAVGKTIVSSASTKTGGVHN